MSFVRLGQGRRLRKLLVQQLNQIAAGRLGSRLCLAAPRGRGRQTVLVQVKRKSALRFRLSIPDDDDVGQRMGRESAAQHLLA
jgi:hypothetical protein